MCRPTDFPPYADEDLIHDQELDEFETFYGRFKPDDEDYCERCTAPLSIHEDGYHPGVTR